MIEYQQNINRLMIEYTQNIHRIYIEYTQNIRRIYKLLENKKKIEETKKKHTILQNKNRI